MDEGNRGLRTRFLLPFEPCDILPPAQQVKWVTAERARRLLRATMASAWPRPDTLRTATAATFALLPFQLEPAMAFLGGHTVRALVADGVGLGKTVQAGLLVAELLARHADARVLIVVPASLQTQWQEELVRHFGLPSLVARADSFARWSSAGLRHGTPWTMASTVIVSIDFLKRVEVLRALEPLVWDLVIFDEAHQLAGASDRHRAASVVAGQALGVLMLSATPHSGDEGAWQRLCGIGDIDNRFPLRIFRRTRVEAGRPSTRRSIWLRTKQTPAASLLHEALFAYARRVWQTPASPGARLAMLVLLKRAGSGPAAIRHSLLTRRRLLEHDGAQQVEEQLVLPLAAADDEAPQADLGSPGLTGRDEELATLDTLIRLASAVRGDKLSALVRLVRRTGEALIVFTQYRDTLEEVVAALGAAHAVVIHGGLSAAERHRALQQFTSGRVRLLVATDAASEGLNLHARCRLVVSLDLPWTPVRLEQRIGRIDRIGQTRRIHAIQMVAAGTYEEEVASRLHTRTAIASGTLDALRAEPELEAAAHLLAAGEGVRAIPSIPPDDRHEQDLRPPATAEAARIRGARHLAVTARSGCAIGPFVTTLPGSRTETLFGWRLTLSDPTGMAAFDTLVGGLHGAPPDVDLALISAAVGPHLWAASPCRQLMQPWRRQAARLLRRLRAVRAVLIANRARLAATLAQGTLFGTRTARTTTPQLQLLDDALARLHLVSARTRAVAHVRVEDVVVAFLVERRRP